MATTTNPPPPPRDLKPIHDDLIMDLEEDYPFIRCFEDPEYFKTLTIDKEKKAE